MVAAAAKVAAALAALPGSQEQAGRLTGLANVGSVRLVMAFPTWPSLLHRLLRQPLQPPCTLR